MSISSKYTKEERRIATEIYSLQTLQVHRLKKYMDTEAKILELKQKLVGKYKPRYSL